MRIYRIIGKEGRVTIPCVLRACAGFESNDIVSFELVSENAVLVRREKLRDTVAPQKEMPSLKELLDGLSESQRCAARSYLSILVKSSGENLP